MNDAEALDRCRRDPRFFIERMFWIINKERQKVPFIFNKPQQKYYEHRGNRDLILKARKEGFSTLIEAMYLHACLFQRNVNAITMSHTLDDTIIHLERVRHFLATMGLPDMPIKVELDKENQRELSFPATNSKYWIGTAGSRAFGRGRDVTHLHLSEVAHYENQSVLTGVMEACVPGAQIAMETTANGVGEIFNRLWKEAEDPNSGSPWRRHFFSWFEDPTNSLDIPAGVRPVWNAEDNRIRKAHGVTDRQAWWYKQKRAGMADPRLMVQEYPSTPEEAFLSSGGNVFNVEALGLMRRRAVPATWRGEVADDGRTVAWSDLDDGNLRVWKHPRQGRSYLIAADTAEGVMGGDYLVAQVLDRSSWEQVAVWRGHVDPGTFGKVLCDIGYYYNSAVLLPENNNHGWATIERIRSESYPHLIKNGEIGLSGEASRADRYGFPTDARSKPLAVTALRNAVDEQTIYINDGTTIEEMASFVRYQNGELGPADKEKGHDDCVMSLAIGAYALKFMAVDETYAPRARATADSPFVVSSAIPAAPKKSTRRRDR